jgi:hypothetical protein
MIASKERQYISGGKEEGRESKEEGKEESKLRPRILMCIGQAGEGWGSRIGGHLKYGCHQLRSRHRRYVTIAMTNEHRSSQTCFTCFSPVVRPQERVTKNGQTKLKSVHGGSICYNSACPSYKAGTNTKNRDVGAAVNIALAGLTSMLGGTLPPFNPSTSQCNTGKLIYPASTGNRCGAVPTSVGIP